ncbi:MULTISPECIES: TM2 domain-containing protein [Corynebacterium]|uniref:TM2 domain-containing protein n=1 Tax=Corynebacterium TaxID=1716 RepID=UPI00257E3EE9|nr:MULTISPECIES: TM2 domain-containing protein [Corynebacterium]
MVDVVGEIYHADAIQTAVAGLSPAPDGSFHVSVSIVPELDNKNSATGTALSIRSGDEVLGFIPEALSAAYFPEFSRVYESGAVATTMATVHIESRLDGDLGFQLRLALSGPNTNVPINEPPSSPWALLPFGESLAVEAATDADVDKQSHPHAVFVTLKERPGQAVALLDVSVDAQDYGRLGDTDSEALLPLVRHYEALGLIVAGFATTDSQGRLFLHAKRAAQISEEELEPQVNPLPALVPQAPTRRTVPREASPFATASEKTAGTPPDTDTPSGPAQPSRDISNPFLDPRPEPQSNALLSAPTPPPTVPAQLPAQRPATGPSPYGSPYGLSAQEESPLTVSHIFSEHINRPVMWLLWLFTGFFGGHRFYLGNYGIGTLQLLTFGGFGLWTLADAFLISNRARNIDNGIEPRWKF